MVSQIFLKGLIVWQQRLRKGDQVIVITGKDKGRIGEIKSFHQEMTVRSCPRCKYG